MDYSKGGGQRAASCRSLTGLLQSPHFLCSNVLGVEQINLNSIILNGKICCEIRVFRDMSYVMERIKFVTRGTTVVILCVAAPGFTALQMNLCMCTYISVSPR